jgi:predicted transcriptional regulator
MYFCQTWSDNDISLLKNLYLTNQPIKIISKILNRTIPSVNKALSRFGIRAIQKRNDVSISKSRVLSPRDQKERTKRKINFTSEKWVKFPEVLDFLKGKGHLIEMLVEGKSQPKLHVDDKELHPYQILIMANKIRLQNHQPIFLVGDISC